MYHPSFGRVGTHILLRKILLMLNPPESVDQHHQWFLAQSEIQSFVTALQASKAAGLGLLYLAKCGCQQSCDL